MGGGGGEWDVARVATGTGAVGVGDFSDARGDAEAGDESHARCCWLSQQSCGGATATGGAGRIEVDGAAAGAIAWLAGSWGWRTATAAATAGTGGLKMAARSGKRWWSRKADGELADEALAPSATFSAVVGCGIWNPGRARKKCAPGGKCQSIGPPYWAGRTATCAAPGGGMVGKPASAVIRCGG